MTQWEASCLEQEYAIRTQLQVQYHPERVCRVALQYLDAGVQLHVGQIIQWGEDQHEEEWQWIHEGWSR
eukprot:8137865-Alexandrium_andersonii.AAC.1